MTTIVIVLFFVKDSLGMVLKNCFFKAWLMPIEMADVHWKLLTICENGKKKKLENLVRLLLGMPADEALFVKPPCGANKSEHCWVPHMCDPNIYCVVN